MAKEEAARRVGRGAGRETGRSVRGRQGRRADKVLVDLGFEPRREGERVLLANCPFHSLARSNPRLVCGLNHAFVAGVIEGTQETATRALRDPAPGRCCVTLEEVPDA